MSKQLEICWSPTRRRKARIGGLRADTHITARDAANFDAAQRQVFDALRDGDWWTNGDLRRLTGQEAADRRLREVIELINRLELGIVEKRRQPMTRVFEYRLKLNSIYGDTVSTGNTYEGLPGQAALGGKEAL